MKVLKNNFNETSFEDIKEINPYPRKHICEHCQSELEYEESDLRMGALGCMFLDCPLCGRENMLESNENSITLNVNNLEFPTHFFYTSKETGAVDICNNKEVRKRIKEAISYFRNNKDEFCWYTYCGNLCIEVFRYSGDEEYEVIVTNNYYNTYIPFETEDYI